MEDERYTHILQNCERVMLTKGSTPLTLHLLPYKNTEVLGISNELAGWVDDDEVFLQRLIRTTKYPKLYLGVMV